MPINLRLRITDAFGETITQSADVVFDHQQLASERKIIRGVDASKTVAASGLRRAPRGLYRMRVDLPSHHSPSRFVNIPARRALEVEVRAPTRPEKVADVRFPAYADLPKELQALLERSDSVLEFEGLIGEPLYARLDPIRKAGLLNIAAKSLVTPLSNEKVVFPYFERLLELRGDRFFATAPKALREETKNSATAGLFDPVSSLLHHPPGGFSAAGSFKTPDPAGNLQLTFFMRGDETVLDVDIDDAGGFAHVFQVLRNRVTGRPTHPYDIAQILFTAQSIDAGYRFVV